MPDLRTVDEIMKRFEERRADDMLGFEVNEYLEFMPYDRVKPFLSEKAPSKEEWDAKIFHLLNREELLKKMLEYMDFAWEKAINCRGISASRSISHYIAWTWLLGDMELSKKLDEGPYEFYGKDLLVLICKHYGWDPEKWDDHRRVNSEEE